MPTSVLMDVCLLWPMSRRSSHDRSPPPARRRSLGACLGVDRPAGPRPPVRPIPALAFVLLLVERRRLVGLRHLAALSDTGVLSLRGRLGRRGRGGRLRTGGRRRRLRRARRRGRFGLALGGRRGPTGGLRLAGALLGL